MADIERPARPGVLAAVAFTGILAGGFVGGATNAVNGLVSPLYFVTILGWPNVDVWRAAIAQGVFEGLLTGFAFSVIFTIATAIITGGTCSFPFAFKHLLGIVAAIFVLWIVGGLVAMGLATLSPQFYRAAFIGVPDDFDEMLRYAWVGGSIWGAQIGGLLCTVLCLVYLRANWRRVNFGLREARYLDAALDFLDLRDVGTFNPKNPKPHYRIGPMRSSGK
jgi:hypothetical protein